MKEGYMTKTDFVNVQAKKLTFMDLHRKTWASWEDIKIGFMKVHLVRMLALHRKTPTFVPNPSATRLGC
ncbi:hypothetical protein [Spirosoma pomorum]